jgi:hypothetical protein
MKKKNKPQQCVSKDFLYVDFILLNPHDELKSSNH